jgi:predicted metal-dependent hydrolase
MASANFALIDHMLRDDTQYYRYNDTDIPYTIEWSSRSHRVRITVDPLNGIRLIVPKRGSISNAMKFFEEKIEWIHDEWLRIEKTREKQQKYLQPLLEKNSISYLGKEYQLVIEVGEKVTPPVSIEDDVFVIHCVSESLAEGILERWYRKQAKAVIVGALEYYRAQMKLKYNNLTIKDQRTRWGSCSTQGNLNFSWRLIMAPKEVLDYVVVHELAHLVHMDHSKKFWNVVEKYMPDYRRRLRWLKDNGISLRI